MTLQDEEETASQKRGIPLVPKRYCERGARGGTEGSATADKHMRGSHIPKFGTSTGLTWEKQFVFTVASLEVRFGYCGRVQ